MSGEGREGEEDEQNISAGMLEESDENEINIYYEPEEIEANREN